MKAMKKLMLYRIYSILGLLCLSELQASYLINGPMLSDLTYREAQVWIQTDEAVNARIQYFENSNPNVRFISPTTKTFESNGFTTNITLKDIEPNKSYTYYVEINGDIVPEKYTFNSLNYFYGRMPPPDIKIAILGSHYAIDPKFEPPYRKLGGGYDIFQKVFEVQPNLIIWAGNTCHLRKSDIDSKNGYLKRYTHARSVIKPKKLLAEIPNLAIWSQNDYSLSNAGSEMSLKNVAIKTFSSFWPKTKLVSHQEAICYSHKISDVEFFFIDVNSERKISTSVTSESIMLGNNQIEWLKNALLNSNATFKIIVSGAPVLNPSKIESNLSYADNEKKYLINSLKSLEIPGLLFVSGGSYKGELTRTVHSTHYNFFDLTVGPSTAIPITKDDQLNFYRIPGTNTFEQQYTIFEIKGDENDRLLEMQIFSIAGIKLWSRTIKARELVPIG